MIKKYRVVKDHVELVTDHNSVLIRSNIGVSEEQLIQENVIEFLKDGFSQKKEQQRNLEIERDVSRSFASIFSVVSAISGAMGVSMAAWFYTLDVNLFLSFFCGMVPCFCATGFTFKEGYRSRTSSKKRGILSSEREFLCQSLEREKRRLEDLQEQQREESLTSKGFVDLYDQGKVQSYKTFLSCYREYLMHVEKYQGAYQNGNLERVLKRNCEPDHYEAMYKTIMMDTRTPEQAVKTYQLMFPQKRS